MNLFFLLALILVPLTSSANEPEPKSLGPACNGSAYQYGDFAASHQLKSGARLHICGFKTKAGIVGQLLLEKNGQESADTGISLGQSEYLFPLKDPSVTTRFTSDGIVITDYIQVNAEESVAAYERTVICKEKCTEGKKSACVFKKLNGKIDARATKAVQKMAQDRNAPLTGSDLMLAYQNALAGDRTAYLALTNPAFLKTMNRFYASSEEDLGDIDPIALASSLKKVKAAPQKDPILPSTASYAEISRVLKQLRKNKCL